MKTNCKALGGHELDHEPSYWINRIPAGYAVT